MYQVCDPVEGSSQEAAYSAAKEVIATYPEIGGFIGCDTNDPPGIAMAVEEAGKAGDIAVTGTCLVSQAKDYLNSGTIKDVYKRQSQAKSFRNDAPLSECFAIAPLPDY